jgi:hypothetical protein
MRRNPEQSGPPHPFVFSAPEGIRTPYRSLRNACVKGVPGRPRYPLLRGSPGGVDYSWVSERPRISRPVPERTSGKRRAGQATARPVSRPVSCPEFLNGHTAGVDDELATGNCGLVRLHGRQPFSMDPFTHAIVGTAMSVPPTGRRAHRGQEGARRPGLNLKCRIGVFNILFDSAYSARADYNSARSRTEVFRCEVSARSTTVRLCQ